MTRLMTLAASFLTGLLGLSHHAAAQTWNFADTSNLNSNPNGPWQSGWAQTLNDPFSLFTNQYSTGWNRGVAPYPEISILDGSSTLAPGGGGTTGGTEFDIFRWVSPAGGPYSFHLELEGYWDNSLVDADIYVRVSGVGNVLPPATLRRRGQPPLLLTNAVYLNEGQALEIWIGIGVNGLGDWDRVILAGEITALCGTSDFNGDGDFGTDQDIEAFFACLGGVCCPTCFASGSDFNGDGDAGTDQDIEAFFRVLAGGPC